MTESDVFGKTHRESGYPEELSLLWEEKIKKVFDTAEPNQFEFEWESSNGTVFLDWRLTPELAENGRVNSVLGVSRDITHRRRLEEELLRAHKELETRVEERTAEVVELGNELRTVLDTMPIGATFLKDRKLLFVNRAFDVIFGYEIGTTKGMDTADFYPNNETYEPVGKDAYATIAGGKIYTMVKEMKKKDGSLVWCRIVGQAVNEEKPEKGSIWMFQDITEHKRSEEVLRESEEKFRVLFENAKDGIFLMTCQGVIVSLNTAFADMHGYTLQEMNQMKISDLDTSETSCSTPERLRRVMAGESLTFEVEQYHKDGHLLSLEVSTNQITLGAEKYILAFHRDISDRKLAEETLRKSERLYHSLVETSQDLIWQCDAEGRFTYLNLAVEHVLGYDLNEMLGVKFTEFQSPDSAAHFLGEFNRLMQGESIDDFESTFIGKSANKISLIIKAIFTSDENGKMVGAIGTAFDITERKQAEDALRKSEQQFKLMFRNHSAVMLLVEPLSGAIIDANLSAENFYGYSHETMLEMNIAQLNTLLHDEILHEMHNVYERKNSYLEFQHKVASGDLRTVEVHSSPIIMQGVSLLFSIIHDISARKQAEEERQEYLFFIETLLANAPIGIRVLDGNSGKCLLANQAAANIAGGDIETMQTQSFRELVSWQTSGLLEVAEAVLADGCACMGETGMMSSFGKQELISYIVSRFVLKEKPHLLVIARDITVEKHLADKNRSIKAQMLHVQKLESLGVLAGGIAHDFNNILLAILGNAELALMRLSPESPVCNHLENILKAGQRAADLAQQMLAYSGKGRFVIDRLDINALITEMNKMLDVSVSKKAVMHLSLTDKLPLFEGDATQIRQTIMNLVINASEAIGDENGAIAITTGFMDCDQAYLSEIWVYDKLEKGAYVYFEVTDNGCGMDRDTLAKIFDPFFTTKFTGRGLGMAAVLGIVRGHHGAITVYSELGKGTSFKVFLPARLNIPEISLPEPTPIKPAMGSGTILLVDDEVMILTLGKEMLQKLGYCVLTAENGVVAVEIFNAHKEEIVCVILDLTMPCLDGEQTFLKLQSIDKNIQVIMSSGFNELEVARKFTGDGLAGFIQKPYTFVELSQKIITVIGERRRPLWNNL